MINKLLLLAVLPIINFSPADASTMAELQVTVHETRTLLTGQREKIKKQINDLTEAEREKIQDDTPFLEAMVMYIKLQEALEMDLMFLELETAKHAK